MKRTSSDGRVLKLRFRPAWVKNKALARRGPVMEWPLHIVKPSGPLNRVAGIGHLEIRGRATSHIAMVLSVTDQPTYLGGVVVWRTGFALIV